MHNILILNGPNLNLLGEREPEIYGTKNLDDIASELDEYASENDTKLIHGQYNSESEIITAIHDAKAKKVNFIIFNPGAFTHTSIAIRDAMLGVSIPFFEAFAISFNAVQIPPSVTSCIEVTKLVEEARIAGSTIEIPGFSINFFALFITD